MGSILGGHEKALEYGSEGTMTLAPLSLQAPGGGGANLSGDSPMRVKADDQQG